jgi:hypothetical protein
MKLQIPITNIQKKHIIKKFRNKIPHT